MKQKRDKVKLTFDHLFFLKLHDWVVGSTWRIVINAWLDLTQFTFMDSLFRLILLCCDESVELGDGTVHF